MKKSIPSWLITIALLETVSFVCVGHPAWMSGAAVVATLVMLALAMVLPTTALELVVIEFIIGSKGGLLRFGGDEVGNGGVSLRVLWFAAFMMGWFLRSIDRKTSEEWRTLAIRSWHAGKWYLALVALLVFAFVRGWLRHSPFVFVDANAWGVLLLLVPIVDLAAEHRENFLPRLAAPVAAALTWLCVETLALFYLFSHGFPDSVVSVYLWIRRTGVGEITRILDGQNAFRIFFQSHIYAMLAAVGLAVTMTVEKKKDRIGRMVWLAVLFATILVSFSRSLWIGLITGLVVVVFWLCAMHRKDFLVWTGCIAGSALLAGILVFGIYRFPYPPTPASSLFDAIAARGNVSEDAAVSRWHLLPALWREIKKDPWLGQGFGATVTYVSQDPRVASVNGGSFTTYVFEWGWLDLWLKMGVLSIPLLLFLLGRVAWRVSRSTLAKPRSLAITLMLVSLASVHIFTPYLNHPLGLLALILCEGVVLAHTPARSSPVFPRAEPVRE